MNRLDPPPLAMWLLEHCVPGARDDALAGDLLEEFRHGRSNGWYWRQSLSAVFVGWVTYLGTRSSLFVFAVLWSMLAPAWAVIVERVQTRDLAWPLALAIWAALNLVFIWTGMLLFSCLHRQFTHAQAAKRLMKAFALAAGIFLPLYFATFLLSNLFLWPGVSDMNLRGASPLREIADLRFWADALRLPYFVTFLWSMWSVVPFMASAPVAVLEWNSTATAAPHDAPGDQALHNAGATTRMLGFMVAAGLVNALIAGFVLCRLPEAHHPTVALVFGRAITYLALGAAAGIVGAYLYWHNPASSFRSHPPLPFPLFALMCATGWVWVPAIVLFSEQVSAFSAAVAMTAAFLLAGELRRVVWLTVPLETKYIPAAWDRPMFAEALYEAHTEPDGYLLALSLFAAGWAMTRGANMTAAALLASVACFFRFRTVYIPGRTLQLSREYRRATLRLACVLVPATLITFWALLDGVAHRERLLALGNALQAGSSGPGTSTQPTQQENGSSHVGNGFASIILWPSPPKKQIIVPIEPPQLLAPGTTEPLVIRFNGEYWYLQPPNVRPGGNAHHATGTPLELHIASSNSFPLIMQAHQHLRSPVPVARCREIRVELESRETDPSPIALALWLKSSTADSPAVYLGEQPLRRTPDANLAARETLEYEVPARPKLRTFDEISVMILPDSGHQRVGPRIALEDFEIVPR